MSANVTNTVAEKKLEQSVRVPRSSAFDGYLQLIRKFPLLPIQSAKLHKQALAVANDLLKKKSRHNKLSRHERGYLSILLDLIEDYEKRQFPRKRADDAEILSHLLEAKEVTQVQVQRATGIAAPTISAVISGRRRLTREQIGKLSKYFCLAPTVFSFEN